ncbi:MAG: threonine aldolase family protein [Sulfurimonas sp.]|jgi:predicted RNase H-like nuclease (RuvC/YqgF family)|uniref:hypothetical protein n=1 Tax=Sulfurimonas sp. TaxID=2022749 RepID=UPI0025EAA648|nr:hypothetical protein [Sulfurimonas sp.]MCK9492709.1 threonine aldolase family protein [Sulfurimonas sp.]
MGKNDRKTSLLRTQASLITDLRQQVRALKKENSKLLRKIDCQANSILSLLAEKHHLDPDAQDEVIRQQSQKILELERHINSPDSDHFANTSVTGAALGINVKTLRKLAEQEKIPCIMDGTKYTFNIKAVKKALLEMTDNDIKILNRTVCHYEQKKGRSQKRTDTERLPEI